MEGSGGTGVGGNLVVQLGSSRCPVQALGRPDGLRMDTGRSPAQGISCDQPMFKHFLMRALNQNQHVTWVLEYWH